MLSATSAAIDYQDPMQMLMMVGALCGEREMDAKGELLGVVGEVGNAVNT